MILLTLTDSADITAAFARAVCNVYNSPKQTQGVGYEASGRLEPGVRVIVCSVPCKLSFDKRTTPQPQSEAKVRRNNYKTLSNTFIRTVKKTQDLSSAFTFSHPSIEKVQVFHRRMVQF